MTRTGLLSSALALAVVATGLVPSATPAKAADIAPGGGSLQAAGCGATGGVPADGGPSPRAVGRAGRGGRDVLLAPGATTQSVGHAGAALRIGPGALDRPVTLGITPLAQADLPKLGDGMENVTAGGTKGPIAAKAGGGYRLTPHPFQFRGKVQLEVPYDPKLLGPGFVASDVHTYFYDDRAGCWRALERVRVDTKRRVVVSRTDHFTDVVNSTVAVPEHPEGASFNPTQIKGIQAATPGAGINLIAAPAANSMGDNRLDYPIELPPGRGGVEPELGVSYNSGGGSGWVGQGWDLPMASITVDTRWGVPRYDADRETETYLLNGEQLTPVAHRGAPVARTAEKVFHTRVEGAFARIIRHGSSPSAYRWEVVAKDGSRSFFGAGPGAQAPAAESTLTDAEGNVFLWSLKEARDLNGNFVRYHSVRQSDFGIGDGQTGSQPGTNLYLRKITYTGHGATEGRYSVNFVRDRDRREPRRRDVSIDARGGFKRVTADLLRAIEVKLDAKLIRRYELNYRVGAFEKSLLASISQFGAAGQFFNRHDFNYFDEVPRDAEGNYTAFEDPAEWEPQSDDVKVLARGEGAASALNGNSTTGTGGHLYVGYNPSRAEKKDSVGVKAGAYQSTSKGLLALVDVNGDNLPDKVFEKNGMKFRANRSGPNGTTTFGPVQELNTLPGILTEDTTSGTRGIEAYPGSGSVQVDLVNTFTRSGRYLSDVNGDGLTDLVDGGRVLFGRLDANRVPTYGDDDQTPVPIETGTVKSDGLLADFAAERERLIDSHPLLDGVRRWVAPFDGTVNITGAVQLSPDTAADRAASRVADGVRVAIQREATELWSATIDKNDNTEHAPAGVSTVTVQRGQRIYFRTQSRFDGSLDEVRWDPTITYVGKPAISDVNGLPWHEYRSSSDFTLGGRAVQVSVPANGTLHLSGDLRKSGPTTDDVTVLITRDGTSVFEQTLAAGATGSIPVSLDLDVRQGQKLQWRVKTDSPIDLGRISWVPKAHYTAAEGVETVTNEQGEHILRIDPPYDADMYPVNDLTSPQGFFRAPLTGTASVGKSLLFDFGDDRPTARVVFTVKRRGALLGKSVIDIVDGNVTSTAGPTITVNQGDDLFFDFSTLDPKLRTYLRGRSASVSFENLPPISVPSGFHSAAVNDRFSTGGQASGDAFPQPYRGWGAVGYNGNRDRAGQPIAQDDLVLDEDYKDQLPEEVPPPGTPEREEFEKNPKIKSPNVNPFVAIPAQNRWGGDENTYVAPGVSSSSRLGVDSINLPSADDLAGASAVSRLSQSRQISATGAVGPIGSLGGSLATGGGTGLVDFLDLNGDQFPDVVGAGRVQYTGPTGALGNEQHELGRDSVRSATNWAANVAIGSPARTITVGRGHTSPPGDRTANTARSGNEMPPLGVGANFGVGKSDGHFDLLDINGDGLPDRVFDNGTAALNLGYSFAPPEAWGGGAINDGHTQNSGVNLGFNGDGGNYGFAGGASFARSESESRASLQDMTGDGLLDRVIADGDNPIKVAVNKGNGFAPATTWRHSGAGPQTPLSKVNKDENVNLGGGAYFTFGFCFVFGCIVINPGGDKTVAAVGREEKALRDVNGDGYADHLSSLNDGELRVVESHIDRTNLLKTVTRPLGARMEFDYSRDGNTFDLPQSRWVLSRTTVHDGHAGDGADVQLSTYKYEGGFYDRLERDFYGYRTVVEEHRDAGKSDALTRSVTAEFHNDSYYTRGLLRRQSTTDAEDKRFLESENTYRLRDIVAGSANPRSTTATIAPELVRTDQRFFEGNATPGKSTFSTMEYDDLGNLELSVDAGEPSTTADDVETTVDYSDCPDSHLSVPIGTDVKGGGRLMRHRESTISCATGDVEEVRSRLENGDIAVTNLGYFPNGNLKFVNGPANKTGQRYQLDYTYDPDVDTHVATVKDSFDYRSSSTYDPRFGLVDTSTDFNNQVLRTTYDEFGRSATVVGPYEQGTGRATIEFAYNPAAAVPFAVTKHVDREASGAVRADTIDTISFSDGLGRPVQTKKDASVPPIPGAAPVPVMTISGRTVFDHLGRVVEQFFPTTESKGPGNTVFNPGVDTVAPTRTSYDVLDRAIRTVSPDSQDPAGKLTTSEFGFGPDRAGVTQFRTVNTDANGKKKETFTDVRELTTAIKEFNPTGGQSVIWTSYEYDPLGQVVKVADDKNNLTTSAYDNFGRRTVVDNPDTGRTVTTYDLADNPIRKVTAKLAVDNKAIEYDYDRNRLTAIRYPTFPKNNVSYTYGAPGAADGQAARISSITDGAGSVQRKYGRLGEVVHENRTVTIPGKPAQSFVTEYRFDTWNRVLQMSFPDGEVLTYSYNSGGLVDRAVGVKGTRTYPYLTRMDYDKFEQRVLLETGNGTRTRYSYDAADRRVENQLATLNDGYVFQNLSYDYDKAGNITALANNTQPPSGPEVGRQVGGPSTQTFQYDDLHRLTHASGTYQSRGPQTNRYQLDLSYDSIHNITNKDQLHELVSGGNIITQEKTTYDNDYTYGSSQPHAPSQLGPFTIGYDANGNQISRSQQPQPRRQLIWDEENRLACSHENVQTHTLPQDPSGCDNPGGAPAVHYTYDDTGNRVVKNSSHTHIYPNQYFSTRNDAGFKHIFVGDTKLVTKFVEPPNREEDRQFWAHTDHLGSTGFVTDDSGGLSEHLNYFPGGETWVSEHPDQPIPLQYTGKEFDPETGLYYYGARYYDPQTSQWQSPDPILEDYLDGAPNGGVLHSPNLALYTYVYNNPILLTDPDGTNPWARRAALQSAGEQMAKAIDAAPTAAAEFAAGVGAEVVDTAQFAWEFGPFQGLPDLLAQELGYEGPAQLYQWGMDALDVDTDSRFYNAGKTTAAVVSTASGVGAAVKVAKHGTKALKALVPNARKALDLAKFRRPWHFRKGVRDQAWENAKGLDGKVRDPKSGKVMKKGEPWDMGHKPGYEFRKHQESAKKRGITRKQFLDEYNNPDHYRPEFPSGNRGRSMEDKSGTYRGPSGRGWRPCGPVAVASGCAPVGRLGMA